MTVRDHPVLNLCILLYMMKKAINKQTDYLLNMNCGVISLQGNGELKQTYTYRIVTIHKCF